MKTVCIICPNPSGWCVWKSSNPNTCTGCGQCWTRCPDSASGFIEDIAAVREKILENIKLSLSEALPTDDLDVLAKGLEAIHSGRKTPLSALTEQQGLIDAARLRRLVKTSQALGDLKAGMV